MPPSDPARQGVATRKCTAIQRAGIQTAGERVGALVDCALPRIWTTLLSRQLTYRDAGVDIDAGDELIRRIAPAAQRTKRPEMLAGIGGFAALAALPSRYREPVLVTGTDGVGTKLKLAIDQNRHDSVGQDLVAMCVNDVLVTGGEPFLFLDYYATSRLDVDVAERVIKGIARACELAGCALAGGETAEMPGFYGKGDYDLAGFCVGVVERDQIIDGSTIAAGHTLDRSDVERTTFERLFVDPTHSRRSGADAVAAICSNRCWHPRGSTFARFTQRLRRSASPAWPTSPAAASSKTCRGCSSTIRSPR